MAVVARSGEPDHIRENFEVEELTLEQVNQINALDGTLTVKGGAGGAAGGPDGGAVGGAEGVL
jgi:diketogulonate reductase-like aldo/keto reductase